VAVNSVTNKIYVANQASDNLTVIDGTTNLTITLPVGGLPIDVAVNPITNKIYVAIFDTKNVKVIDGATGFTHTLAAGNQPNAIAVNPLTNLIYVVNPNSQNVTVIDGATNLTTTLTAGTTPEALAVNPVTNKIYIVNGDSDNVTVVDGATNHTTTVAAGTEPAALMVNPVTNKVYVTNKGSNDVIVITEQDVQPSSPYTSINGLPDHTSNTCAPTFTIQADSHYNPIAPRVQQVYYQVDTWQGEWLSAIENPGLNLVEASATSWWKAKIPSQDNGIHILYAYAVDGQEAGSVNPSPSYSPIIGYISAYLFLVEAVGCEWWPVMYYPVVFR